MEETRYDTERLIGFSFLVSLLLLAGTTASIVAYRIKSIEWSTRSSLETTYRNLVVHPEDPIILKPLDNGLNENSRKFILTYEFNQHVRAFGLIKTLKDVPPQNIEIVDSVLKDFKNSDASPILNDVKRELDQNPEKAKKIAKSYNTPESRKVDRELYKFGLAVGLISSSREPS